jgi:ketosteroid isomerase-like protein
VRRAFAATAAALALLSGCGGGATNQDQIKKVLGTYYQAFANGDSATACDQLAKDTVKNLEKQARGRSCSDVLNQALQQPDYAAVAAKLKNAKFSNITAVDDKATAAVLVPGVAGKGVRTSVQLKKEGDSWKIVTALR